MIGIPYDCHSCTHTYANTYANTSVDEYTLPDILVQLLACLCTHKEIRNNKTLTCSSCIKNKSTGKEGCRWLEYDTHMY